MAVSLRLCLMMWLAVSLAAVACRSGEGAGAQPTPIDAGGSVEPSGSGGKSTGGGSGANGAGGSGSAGGSGGGDGSDGMPFFDALPLPEVSPAFEVGPPVDAGALIERVAFGSCDELARTQDFWTRIIERNPQVFLSLGDLPYVDYGDTFAVLAEVPGFKQLLAVARMLVIWDDHDYGMNDGGAAYAGKLASKKRFIDFWGGLGVIPPESPRRTREGNYDSLVLGPVGRQIQFIMLDNRYFKGVAPSGTVLGPEQWQWLAEELRRPATLRIIMSGIAAVGSSSSSDAWAQYPAEQQRLYDVIKDFRPQGRPPPPQQQTLPPALPPRRGAWLFIVPLYTPAPQPPKPPTPPPQTPTQPPTPHPQTPKPTPPNHRPAPRPPPLKLFNTTPPPRPGGKTGVKGPLGAFRHPKKEKRRWRQRRSGSSGDGVPVYVTQSWCAARVIATCSRRRGVVGPGRRPR